MKKRYMLDTCICSYIMREQPIEVLEKLQIIAKHHQIVISAITYAEMRYGAVGKKASPKHNKWVDQFVMRLDAILPWDVNAVDEAARIKKELNDKGSSIGPNDTAIAGHAIATECILVTNNSREFRRVTGLNWEDWVNSE
jgi:tRNA(fMet)-specific endonuclease VapC